jgi:hypothetical protein
MATVLAAEPVGAVSGPESPYVGLVPYEEGDAEFFFGRSTEAAIVAANLRAARLTLLYGPSGVGKSSMLMAGAVHLLREQARAADDEEHFAVCVHRSWRDDPLRGVEDAARAALQDLDPDEALPASAATLVGTLREWTASRGTLLVVFDQFEEYFQYHPDEQGSGGFAEELARIVNHPTLAVNVLLSIREDALAKLDRFKGRIPSLFANYLRVDHLDLDAARDAIEGPIAAWNRTLPRGGELYYIEPALTEAVLAAASGGELTLTAGGEVPRAPVDAPGERVEAPFLQLVLERVWRATVAEGAHTLTKARLDALGGAGRIVENHLLDALGRLTPSEQDTASDCFRFLVSSGRTKIAHTPADLAEWTGRQELEVTAVLDTLASGEGGRILRAVAPAHDDDSTTYELFHDVLAEPILAWRRSHDADRRRRAARRRLARVGGISLALVGGFAALTIWALIQRSDARHSERQVAGYNQTLKAQINQLELGSPRVVATVTRLSRENRSLRAETDLLQTRSTALLTQTRQLRAVDRRIRRSILALNARNTALAATINRLNSASDSLGSVLESLQEQEPLLRAGLGFLKVENRARDAELRALKARRKTLLREAAELGVLPPRKPGNTSVAGVSAQLTPATKAKLYGAAGIGGGSNALQRQVAELQRQLAKLIADQARRTDEVAFFRHADALLVRERSALGKEIAQLEGTRTRLESRKSELEATRAKAQHEERRLSKKVVRARADYRSVRNQVKSQRKTNDGLQARDNSQVAALGDEQATITQVTVGPTFFDDPGHGLPGNRKLVALIENPVDRLLQAARDRSVSPGLAGLLAVVGYRVTPFGPDDPAHPQVYNALWLALDRLDARAAQNLIAPSASASGKVGTTRSAQIVEALCAKTGRSLTRAEWRRFLPRAAPYQRPLSQPCS